MLLLAAFAVPAALQQRVLLYGIVGALVLRGVFIALGAAALEAFYCDVPGLRRWSSPSPRSRCSGTPAAATTSEVDVGRMRSVRLLRRFVPVTDDYDGAAAHRSMRTAAGR